MFSAYKTNYKSPTGRGYTPSNTAAPGTPLIGVTAQTFLESHKQNEKDHTADDKSEKKEEILKEEEEAAKTEIIPKTKKPKKRVNKKTVQIKKQAKKRKRTPDVF